MQFANKLGFRTVAIARGADKEPLSRTLGAHHFIDSATEDVAAALNRLGGARAVLATVTSAEAMTPAIEGLAVRGRLIVVGATTRVGWNSIVSASIARTASRHCNRMGGVCQANG